MATLLLPSSTTILLAGTVIKTSLVPTPKSTALLLFELAIGLIVLRVVPVIQMKMFLDQPQSHH